MTARQRSRALWTTAGAVLLGLALALAAAMPAAAREPLVWGVYAHPKTGETQLSALTSLETKVGRQFATVRDFEMWDASWPTSFQTALRARGTSVLLSVRARRSSGQDIRWADIANAADGSALHQQMVTWANRFKAWGIPMYVALQHEPESSSSSGNGTSAEYIAAYRRFMDVMRQQGVTNIKRNWIMTDYSFVVPSSDRRQAIKWYPGDAYVDAISADAYNWSDCRSGIATPWWSLEQIVDPMRRFGLQHPDKELWLTEFGSVEDRVDAQRKARWFADAEALFAKPGWEQFRGVSYFHRNHTTTECWWWADTSPQSLAAFTAMGADPLYSRWLVDPVASRPAVTCTALACSFTSTGSTGAAPLAYAWTFGDGGTATGATAEHAYAAPGSFTATLRVTDGLGRSATASVTAAPARADAPPSAPGVPRATSTRPGEVDVVWAAASDDHATTLAYTVLRDGVAAATVDGPTSGDVAWVDRAVAPHSSHVYAVRAADAFASGPTSEESAPVTVAADEPPGAPGAPVASSSAPGHVELAFAAATDDRSTALAYTVLRDGAPAGAVTGPTTGTITWDEGGLAYGSTHVYAVRASDGTSTGATSPDSEPVVVASDVTAPTAPGAPTATSTRPGEVDLVFAAATDDVAATLSYTVLRDGVPVAAVDGPTSGTITAHDTTASPGATVTYTVRASDGVNTGPESAASDPVLVDADDPPTAPGTPTATSIRPGEVDLAFTAASDDAATTLTYAVLRDGEVAASFDGPATGTIRWTDTGLTPGSTVTYTVRASDGTNTGPESAASDPVLVDADDPPTAPGTPTATSTRPGEVDLAFAAASDDAATTLTYTVLRDGTAVAAVDGPTSGTITAHDTTASPGATVTYTVRASDGVSTGPESAVSDPVVVDADDPPSAPGTPTATSTVPGRVDLAFTAASDDASATLTYTVLRDGTPVRTLTGPTTGTITTADATATPGSTVTYTVRASDGVSTGPESAASDPVLVDADDPPSAPGTPTATSTVPGRVDLAFTAASDDASATLTYTVLRDGTPVRTLTGPTTGTITTADPTATPGSTVTYTVRASDGTNTGPESAASDPVLVDADDPPTAPGTPTATSTRPGEVDLAFTAASDDASATLTYTVLRDGDVAASFDGPAVGTIRWTDTGLTPGSTVTYTVRASDGVSTGPESPASDPVLVDADDPPSAPGRPTATSTVPGRVDLAFAAASDDASATLTYTVLRDGTPVRTLTGPTTGTITTADPTATPGSTVTYTVRASDGTSDGPASAASDPVTVAAAATIAYRAGNQSIINQTASSVTIPAATAPGDLLLLFVTTNSITGTLSNPAGWTLIGERTDDDMRTRLYRRTAVAGDAGSTIAVTTSAIQRIDMKVAAYSGASSTTPIAAWASAAETGTRTTHTTPTVTVPAAGALTLQYWADKSSTTTALTLPGSVTSRMATPPSTVTGRLVASLADLPATPGTTAGGLAATVEGGATYKATMWTVVIGR